MQRGGGGGSESIPLLSNQATVEYGGVEPKVHSGVGLRRVPLKPAPGVGVAAGSTYQRIFEGQLGRAAGDTRSNPLGLFASRDAYYASVPSQLSRLPAVDRRRLIKPYGVPWSKESKKQFPQHWKLVNPRAGQKRVQSGIVLPFSNNIGPGNTIQHPRTAADAIAQGHDLHYQDAKEPSDVLSADREAIGQFIHQAVKDPDPVSQLQGVIGAVGLAAKHLGESLAGKVLYGNVFTLS